VICTVVVYVGDGLGAGFEVEYSRVYPLTEFIPTPRTASTITFAGVPPYITPLSYVAADTDDANAVEQISAVVANNETNFLFILLPRRAAHFPMGSCGARILFHNFNCTTNDSVCQ